MYHFNPVKRRYLSLTSLINKMTDLFGKALYDFHAGRPKGPLLLHNRFSTPDVIDLRLFYDYEILTDSEQYALAECKGTILDAGAASGRHSLLLQKYHQSVWALDYSAYCARIMKERGIKRVLHQDIFDLHSMKFDTILMLMNGIGIVKNLEGLATFFRRIKNHLNSRGQLLFDSCNVAYLMDEYGYLPERYYGEVEFQYEYGGRKGDWFSWLYLDASMLEKQANQTGLHCHIIYQHSNSEYLARLTID